MQDRHLDRKRYFREQSATTERFIVPYVSPFLPAGSRRVLEIGCGEGGNLKPFLEAGFEVTGIDLSSSKIENGLSFFSDHPLKEHLNLICSDIYDMEEPDNPYDLIIMRDVIEHIHRQEQFMHFVKRFLAPQGLFFLAFPPFQNPFGGHQQICRSRILSALPWVHLLPAGWYAWLIKTAGEPRARLDALLEIKSTGLSIDRFEKILKKENYEIITKDFFLINPGYEIKFGIKQRKTPRILWKITGIRNFFTTSAYYLVRRKGYG